MPKVFNVDQLRINGHLLTGSAEGLFFDVDKNGAGERLAQGTSAVPIDKQITAGAGLKWIISNTEYDTITFANTMNLALNVEETQFEIDAQDELKLKSQSITSTELDDNIWGLGLAGGAGEDVDVGGGSGIHAEGNFVNISEASVITSMLLDDAVTNAKLATVSEDNKVQGNALMHDTNDFAFDAGTKKLEIKNAGIDEYHLNTSVAGPGLAGGGGTELSVGGYSGLHVEGNGVNISEEGVINSMISDYDDGDLTKGVADDKLHPIDSTDKVHGSAVELMNGGGLADNNAAVGHVDAGLYIVENAIGLTELDSSSVVGEGLYADNDDLIHVGGGSGIHTEGDFINISEGEIINSMLAGSIAADKLAGGIAVNQTQLSAGNGLTLSTNQMNVGAGDGIQVDGSSVAVTDDVARLLANRTQTFLGNYTFSNITTFLSGITVAGDLEVRGSTLVTEVNEVNIGDAVIVLNADYEGGNAEDAGIEINRGTQDTQNILFDDFGTNEWVIGKQGGEGKILTGPRVKTDRGSDVEYQGAWSMSKQLMSGVTRESVLFSEHPDISVFTAGTNELEAVPNVIVSIQNTGMAVTDPSTIDGTIEEYADLLSCMVTAVNTTGFNVDFSSAIPSSGDISDYRIKAWVTTSDIYSL